MAAGPLGGVSDGLPKLELKRSVALHVWLWTAAAICISESAHRQVENKLPLRHEDAGEHEVKNTTKPVRGTVLAPHLRLPSAPRS